MQQSTEFKSCLEKHYIILKNSLYKPDQPLKKKSLQSFHYYLDFSDLINTYCNWYFNIICIGVWVGGPCQESFT